MYHQQIDDIADIEWLQKADLKESTEALIMAAQQQVRRIRSIEEGVHHSEQGPWCMLCKEAPEKVQHKVTGYEMQAKSRQKRTKAFTG